MKKLAVGIVTVFFVFLMFTSHAVAVSFNVYGSSAWTTDTDGVPTTTQGGATVWDFDNAMPTVIDSITGSYSIVEGSKLNEYKAPGEDSDLTNNTNYLVVPKDGDGQTGTARIKLTGSANYFGLFWGSIDSYNTLSFYKADTVVGTLTGTNIAGALGLTPLTGNYDTDAYVEFFGGSFDSVEFYTTNRAFEVDNVAIGVPEPGTLFLLGFSFLGLIGIRIRKRFF